MILTERAFNNRKEVATEWDQDYIDTIEALHRILARKDTEAKELLAGAYLAAANTKYVFKCWDSTTGLMMPEEVSLNKSARERIIALTPADAERSLQVYAQGRVVETARWCIHRRSEPYSVLEAYLMAATARLAELKK